MPDKKEESKEIIIPEPVSIEDKLKEQEELRGYGKVQDISNEEEQKEKSKLDHFTYRTTSNRSIKRYKLLKKK